MNEWFKSDRWDGILDQESTPDRYSIQMIWFLPELQQLDYVTRAVTQWSGARRGRGGTDHRVFHYILGKHNTIIIKYSIRIMRNTPYGIHSNWITDKGWYRSRMDYRRAWFLNPTLLLVRSITPYSVLVLCSICPSHARSRWTSKVNFLSRGGGDVDKVGGRLSETETGPQYRKEWETKAITESVQTNLMWVLGVDTCFPFFFSFFFSLCKYGVQSTEYVVVLIGSTE